jgi:hypothetical protein
VQALNDSSLVLSSRQTILAPAHDRECFFIPLPCHLIEGYQQPHSNQQQPSEDLQQHRLLPTAFSLHYRIQKENVSALMLKMPDSKDDEKSVGAPFAADGAYSFEVNDPLTESVVAMNATRIISDLINNISRVLLAPR